MQHAVLLPPPPFGICGHPYIWHYLLRWELAACSSGSGGWRRLTSVLAPILSHAHVVCLPLHCTNTWQSYTLLAKHASTRLHPHPKSMQTHHARSCTVRIALHHTTMSLPAPRAHILTPLHLPLIKKPIIFFNHVLIIDYYFSTTSF